VYSSHPANFRLPATSQSGGFSFANLSSLKSPVIWAFLIFGPVCRALSFLNASQFSGCCFRLYSIFSRELSRSLVDKWLLVTTPIASGPPNWTNSNTLNF